MKQLKLASLLHDISLAVEKYYLNFDCFSIGQLESKAWVVEEMKNIQLNPRIEFGNIYLLCGWYGLLASMIFNEGIRLDQIRSFDIDPDCRTIANRINRTMLKNSWKFQAITEDIYNIDFTDNNYIIYSGEKSQGITDTPDTIINTSCEHTDSSWFDKVLSGSLVILQSNNFWDGNGHINCVTDLDEFKERYPMKTILYEGARSFQKYDRFMLIGEK